MNGAGITDLMHRVIAASTGAPEPAVEITLPGVPASVPAARRFVADGLPGCPRADDLMLAVSELTSNAVAWSASGRGGTFTVRVQTAPQRARAEVTDDGPAPGSPAPGSPAPGDSPGPGGSPWPGGSPERGNGWGLGIVAAVTDRAGAVTGPDGRRTAWAEVTWAP